MARTYRSIIGTILVAGTTLTAILLSSASDLANATTPHYRPPARTPKIVPPRVTPPRITPPKVYRPPSIKKRSIKKSKPKVTKEKTTTKKPSAKKAKPARKAVKSSNSKIKKKALQNKEAASKKTKKTKRKSTQYPQKVGKENRGKLKYAQALLTKLGFDAGMPDGFYGPKTEQAMLDFYKALKATNAPMAERYLGEMNAGTIVNANSYYDYFIKANDGLNAAGVKYKQTIPFQKRDMFRDTQTTLNRLGYDAGPADMLYGPKTEEALIKFSGALRADNPSYADKFLTLIETGKVADAHQYISWYVSRHQDKLQGSSSPKSIVSAPAKPLQMAGSNSGKSRGQSGGSAPIAKEVPNTSDGSKSGSLTPIIIDGKSYTVTDADSYAKMVEAMAAAKNKGTITPQIFDKGNGGAGLQAKEKAATVTPQIFDQGIGGSGLQAKEDSATITPQIFDNGPGGQKLNAKSGSTTVTPQIMDQGPGAQRLSEKADTRTVTPQVFGLDDGAARIGTKDGPGLVTPQIYGNDAGSVPLQAPAQPITTPSVSPPKPAAPLSTAEQEIASAQATVPETQPSPTTIPAPVLAAGSAGSGSAGGAGSAKRSDGDETDKLKSRKRQFDESSYNDYLQKARNAYDETERNWQQALSEGYQGNIDTQDLLKKIEPGSEDSTPLNFWLSSLNEETTQQLTSINNKIEDYKTARNSRYEDYVKRINKFKDLERSAYIEIDKKIIAEKQSWEEHYKNSISLANGRLEKAEFHLSACMKANGSCKLLKVSYDKAFKSREDLLQSQKRQENYLQSDKYFDKLAKNFQIKDGRDRYSFDEIITAKSSITRHFTNVMTDYTIEIEKAGTKLVKVAQSYKEERGRLIGLYGQQETDDIAPDMSGELDFELADAGDAVRKAEQDDIELKPILDELSEPDFDREPPPEPEPQKDQFESDEVADPKTDYDPLDDLKGEIDIAQRDIDGDMAAIKQYEAEIGSIKRRGDIDDAEKKALIDSLTSQIEGKELAIDLTKKKLDILGSEFDGYDGRNFDNYDPYKIRQTDTNLKIISDFEKEYERAHKIIEASEDSLEKYDLHDRINDLVERGRENNESLTDLAGKLRKYGDGIYQTRKQDDLNQLILQTTEASIDAQAYLEGAYNIRSGSAGALIVLSTGSGLAAMGTGLTGASSAGAWSATAAWTGGTAAAHNIATGGIEGYYKIDPKTGEILGWTGSLEGAGIEAAKEFLPVNTYLLMNDENLADKGYGDLALAMVADVFNTVGIKNMAEANLNGVTKVKASIADADMPKQHTAISAAAESAKAKGRAHVEAYKEAVKRVDEAKVKGFYDLDAEKALNKALSDIEHSTEAKLQMKDLSLDEQGRFNAHQAERIRNFQEAEFEQIMKEQLGWSESGTKLKSIRNKSSAGTVGLDDDLAIAAEPTWIDKNPDGSNKYYGSGGKERFETDTKRFRDSLTKNGRKATLAEYQRDAEWALNEASLRVTGKSAPQARLEATSSAADDAFKDMRLLDGDGALTSGSRGWAEQSAGVTRNKAQKAIQYSDRLGLNSSGSTKGTTTPAMLEYAVTEIKAGAREVVKDIVGKAWKIKADTPVPEKIQKQVGILTQLSKGDLDPAQAHYWLMTETNTSLTKTLDSLSGHMEAYIKKLPASSKYPTMDAKTAITGGKNILRGTYADQNRP